MMAVIGGGGDVVGECGGGGGLSKCSITVKNCYKE